MDHTQLSEELKKNIKHNAYLFYGEEQYLIKQAIKVIKKKLINPEYVSFNYEFINGETSSIHDIINACETLPFMDKYRMVLVKDLGLLSSTADGSQQQEVFMKYLNNISKSTILIFWQNKGLDKRKKIYKTIKKIGVDVEFNHLKPYELKKWIHRFFKKREINAEDRIIDYFINNLSGDMEDLVNEMNKVLGLIGEEKEIQLGHVEMVLSRTLENSIFKLIDYIGLKRTDDALSIFKDLVTQGEAPVMISSMISRQFIIIYKCKYLLKNHYSTKDIASKLCLHPFITRKAEEQCNSFTFDELNQALDLCLETDKNIKSGKMEEKLSVELLIIQCTKK